MNQIFSTARKGIGQADYTVTVERSTATLLTPSLRQEVILLCLTDTYAVAPYPSAYQVFCPMPQEDGTFGWEASSIKMHFLDFSLALRNNCLCRVGLLRYSSLASLLAGDPPDAWYPDVHGYGRVTLKYTKAVATQPGRVYAIFFGFWSDNATEEVSLDGYGILTDLTLEWMMS